MYRWIYDPGMGPYCPQMRKDSAGSTSPSHSAISRLGGVFYIVLGRIDPGDHRFRPRAVEGF